MGAVVTPRFRQDLVAATADEDGVTYVDVQDEQSGRSFRFYDYEYALAQQLNGQPIDDVVGWAANYGMEIDAEAITAFAAKLDELGYLEASTTPAPERVGAETTGEGEGRAADAWGAGPTEADRFDEPAPVSQVVSHLMTAPPGDADSPDAYGVGELPTGEVDSLEDAEAEWASPDGERTANGEAGAGAASLSDAAGGADPGAPARDDVTPPFEVAGDQRDAMSEFMEDDATGHWVPKMVPERGGAGGGAEAHRDRARWAMDLRDNLQSGPHQETWRGGGDDDRPEVAGLGDHDLTVLGNPDAPDPDATPPPAQQTPSVVMHAPSVDRGGGAPGRGAPLTPEAAGAPSPWGPVASTPAPVAAQPRLVTPLPIAASAVGTPTRAAAPGTPPPLPLDNHVMTKERPPARPEVASAGLPDNLLRDRRQPPPAEAVVMAPFQVGGEGATATAPAPPAKLFRLNETEGQQKRGRGAVLAVAVLVALTVGIGLYLWRQQAERAEYKQVRVITPHPSVVYRWFEATGAVVGSEARVLSFATGGRVAEVMPAGTTFSPGEIVAKLKRANSLALELDRLRSRLGYYQQMHETMVAAANHGETRQEALKLATKRALVGEADRDLASVVIRPDEAGEIAEVFVASGAMVPPGAPVLRIKGERLRGEFTLTEADWETAARLEFCRVEVVGLAPHAANEPARRLDAAPVIAADSGPSDVGSPKFVDCRTPGRSDRGLVARRPGKPRKLIVELPAGTAVKVGQPLRLASARYDAVFPIPREAIVRVGDTDRVYVASRSGIAEPRAVTAIHIGGDDALVTQGLDIGDAVIVAAPAGLRDGSRLRIDR